MPLQLTRRGVTRPDAAELARLRHAYAAVHCVLLREFLEPALRGWVARRALQGHWKTVVHHDLDPPSVDLMLQDATVDGALHAITHAPDLFAAVQAITDCGPIGTYRFRVYRMDAGAGHTDTWHGDDDGNRLVTLSANIGHAPFEGGALEIRERATTRVVHRIHNTGPGDAILFRIDPALEHRVEPVRGAVSKYAIAGWFQRAPVADLARLVRP